MGSMLPVNEFKNGTYFKDKGDPFEVIKYEHQKIGRGGASIKLKARNLKTGGVFDKTYPSGSKLEEANLNKKKAQFLYTDQRSGYFMDIDTYEQFEVDRKKFEGKVNFLKEGMEIFLLEFEGEVIGVLLPATAVYRITETGPSEKGNSTGSVTKPAAIETGAVINVPMFIKNGDVVKVDTRNASYVERVKE